MRNSLILNHPERKPALRIRRSLALVGSLAAATGLATSLGVLPAAADPAPVFPPNPSAPLQAAYGFDGNASLAVGGGSDTTYLVIQKLSDLWNLAQDSGSALCSTNKSPNSFTPGGSYPAPGTDTGAAIAQCDPTAQTFTPSNYDADVIVDGPTAGSSAGIASLNGANGSTAGTYPYEGTNSNVAINGPVNVTAINGGTTVAPGTSITSVQVASLPTGVVAGDTLQIAGGTNGASSDGLKVTGGPYAAGGSTTITVDGTVNANDTYDVTATAPVTATSAVDTVWPKTANGFGTPDFARSSRAPKINKGSCTATGVTGTDLSGNVNDELACDTFWGYAEDGVEMVLFNQTAALSPPITLSPTQIDGIYNCTITNWNQIDTRLSSTQPIVPWAENSNSGTYSAFNSYVQSKASDSAFAADNNVPFGTGSLANNGALTTSKGCVRELGNEVGITGFNSQSGTLQGNQLNPLENDIKSFANDANNFPDTRPGSAGGGAAAGLSTTNTSTQDPENWVWFSSFGVLSTFPYTSAEGAPIPGANSTEGVTSAPASILSGTTAIPPSSSNIFLNKYPINRTLFHVTKKSDADCPLNPNVAITTTLTATVCNFTTNTSAAIPFCNQATNPSGGNELNVITSLDSASTVNGCMTYTQHGTTGPGGAVREFTRWLCRGSNVTGINPFNGDSFSVDITSAINAAGFTAVPSTLRSPGSNCSVFSRG